MIGSSSTSSDSYTHSSESSFTRSSSSSFTQSSPSSSSSSKIKPVPESDSSLSTPSSQSSQTSPSSLSSLSSMSSPSSISYNSSESQPIVPQTCYFQFIAAYNCQTMTFTGADPRGWHCGLPGASVPDAWSYIGTDDISCYYEYWKSDILCIHGECPTIIPAPPPPLDSTFGCACAPQGACCHTGTCTSDVTQLNCTDVLGGSAWYSGQSCNPVNPCLPTGACCVGQTCHAWQNEGYCKDVLGGVWHENVACDPNPCLTSCGGFSGCSATYLGYGMSYSTWAEAWAQVDTCGCYCLNGEPGSYDPAVGPIAHEHCGGFVQVNCYDPPDCTYVEYYPVCCCKTAAMSPQPGFTQVYTAGASGGAYDSFCGRTCCNAKYPGVPDSFVIDNPYDSCGGTLTGYSNYTCIHPCNTPEKCNSGCVYHYGWVNYQSTEHGTYVDYQACSQGACTIGGVCSIMSESACYDAGGSFAGINKPC